MTSKRPPKRNDVEAIPLKEDVRSSDARNFVREVIARGAEIAKAASEGENGEARRLILDAMEELGDLVDLDAPVDEDEGPGELARRVPRGSTPSPNTRAEAERSDFVSTRRGR